MGPGPLLLSPVLSPFLYILPRDPLRFLALKEGLLLDPSVQGGDSISGWSPRKLYSLLGIRNAHSCLETQTMLSKDEEISFFELNHCGMQMWIENLNHRAVEMAR